jgi:hypothetical protein
MNEKIFKHSQLFVLSKRKEYDDKVGDVFENFKYSCTEACTTGFTGYLILRHHRVNPPGNFQIQNGRRGNVSVSDTGGYENSIFWDMTP